ncbi:hypothetical protein M758_3G270800, partial [Ceratodon purpureus]
MRIHVSFCQLGCNSKISQLRRPLFCCKNVGALDISMDNTLFVQIHQSFQNLGNVNGNRRLRERPKFAGFDDASQRSIFHKLENDIQMCFGLKGTLILNDVPMIQIL